MLKKVFKNFVVNNLWIRKPLRKLEQNPGERMPILCYHRILPGFTEHNCGVYAVSPEQFRDQMAFLQENGFNSLSLEEFIEIYRGRAPAPVRSLLVTIDDGYADTYNIAFPISQQYGIKINIFITIAHIDNPDLNPIPRKKPQVTNHIRSFPELWRFMKWDELKSMYSLGASIGLHGYRHLNMANFNEYELKEEIDLSINSFQRNLGFRPKTLALPYGTPGTYNKHVLKQLDHSGVEYIFSTLTGRLRLPNNKMPLPRLVIHGDEDMRFFEMKLFGAFDWIGYIRQIEQALKENCAQIKRYYGFIE